MAIEGGCESPCGLLGRLCQLSSKTKQLRGATARLLPVSIVVDTDGTFHVIVGSSTCVVVKLEARERCLDDLTTTLADEQVNGDIKDGVDAQTVPGAAFEIGQSVHLDSELAELWEGSEVSTGPMSEKVSSDLVRWSYKADTCQTRADSENTL